MSAWLFIDGENFKAKIRSVFTEARRGKPVWHRYDFRGLLEAALANLECSEDSREKSQQLIDEQRLLKTHLERQGFGVVLSGRVRRQVSEDRDGRQVVVFREKGVDVRIAVDMVTFACDRKGEEIVLGSSDSDLQPAVGEVRCRGIRCVYLGFENQPNRGLIYTTDRTILIRNAEVLRFAGSL